MSNSSSSLGKVFRCAGPALALALLLAAPASAQSPGVNLSQLAATVKTLQSQVQSLQNTVTSQAATIAALQAKTASMSVHNGVGTNTELFFSGVNVHIVNGLGATNGNPNAPFDFRGDLGPVATNGLGNLIIGYNSSRSTFNETDTRTGSHNLVLGDGNNYSSFGGIIGGQTNTISGPYASVTGGSSNAASLDFSVVTAGVDNVSSGEDAVVTGGLFNTASGAGSVVAGGSSNKASGEASVVTGGFKNTASGTDSIAP